MSEFTVFAFCAAIGFATAGTISSLYQWITAERADFTVQCRSASGLVVLVLLTMFAGPFIIADKVIAGLRSRQISLVPAVVGTVLAGMWSVCAGIFYVSLLVAG